KKGNIVCGKDGKTPLTRKVSQPKMISDLPEDLQRCIESIAINEAGQAIPKFYSAMQANQELRKLLGIGVVTGDGEDVHKLSDADLVAQLAQQAKELGIEIDLSYNFNGDA